MNQKTEQIRKEIAKAVVGKDQVTEKVLTAILAGGHILLEDIPAWGRRPWRWLSAGQWGWIFSGYSLRRMWCRPISQALPCMKKKKDFITVRGR